MKPALLVDVDGPLNPYRSKGLLPGYVRHDLDDLVVDLNPAHGPALLALTDVFDLVWATTWEGLANEWVAPRIGLPDNLPVITWPSPRPTYPAGRRVFWKTPSVAAWSAGRPFAWVDDEVNRYDRKWLDADPSVGSYLLHRVEPNVGLVDDDFAALRAWAAALPAV